MKNDHNMWAYVFYSIYLDQVDVTNHNAIEKYVYEKVSGPFLLIKGVFCHALTKFPRMVKIFIH